MAKKRMIQLPKDKLLAIDLALRQIHDVRLELEHLERCGDNCQQFKAELDAQQEKLEAYKREFGPGVQ